MQELIEKVIQWGHERGILENSTPQKQIMKSASELGEVIDCMAKIDIENLKLEIGDLIVTLILFCELKNINYRPYIFQAKIIFNLYFLTSNIHRDFDHLFYAEMNGIDLIASQSRIDQVSTSINAICIFYQITEQECLQLAYNKISQRKTKMVNGIAVK